MKKTMVICALVLLILPTSWSQDSQAPRDQPAEQPGQPRPPRDNQGPDGPGSRDQQGPGIACPNTGLGITATVAAPFDIMMIETDPIIMGSSTALGLRFDLGFMALNLNSFFSTFAERNKKTASDTNLLFTGIELDILFKVRLRPDMQLLIGPFSTAGIYKGSTEYKEISGGVKTVFQTQLTRNLGITLDTGAEYRFLQTTGSSTDKETSFWRLRTPTVGVIFYL